MHLVLNRYGTYLNVKNGNFCVNTSEGEKIIQPQKVKTITLSKSSLISSDAVLLALKNNIDIIFVDKQGKPLGRVWSYKFGSISAIRRKQLEFTFSAQAIELIREIIIEKMNNQIALLMSLETNNSELKNFIETVINRINDYKQKVRKIQGETIADVARNFRGWEGSASKNYFEVIKQYLPRQYKFDRRSKRPAKDIFNAMLNYGYGMLYYRIESELIKAGIDPYIGIMHREDYNRPVLTFDIIEKFRVWIDYVVINLLINEAIDEECYTIDEQEGVILEGLGKRILIQSVNDYLEEVVAFGAVRRSRAEQIKLYCQQLAKKFMFFNPEK